MKNITNGYKTPHKNMKWNLKSFVVCAWNEITAQSQTTKLDENDDEQPMELILLYEVDIDI